VGTYAVDFTAAGPFFGLKTWTASGGSDVYDFTIDSVRVFEYLDYLGGRANYIGELVTATAGGITYKQLQFRAPVKHETVFDRVSNAPLRWNTKLGVWETYRTLPQRSLDYQQVFSIFDPDGIYDYYAMICGLLYTKSMQDTKGVGKFLSAADVDPPFLAHLAYTFCGGTEGLSEGQLRTSLRRMLRTHRRKGLGQSITDALLDIGYIGFANAIWVDPTDATDHHERPLDYYAPTASLQYYPTPFVAIHINRVDGAYMGNIPDAVRKAVAKHLKRHVLPAHLQISYFSSSHLSNLTETVGTSELLTNP
jgi:hypothetical protein